MAASTFAPFTHISSDPHAWLRPIYARLLQQPAFPQLTPALQFEALRRAAVDQSPVAAEQMRDWTPAAQCALVGWLANVLSTDPNPVREVELWCVRKGLLEMRCVITYLPNGLDIRLLEGNEFRRTELVKNGPEADSVATRWLSRLVENGWRLRRPPGR